MLANTVTASSRKASPSTGLGAAAVIGYPSSRLPSSSVLIAETSASTASISVTGMHAAAHHIQQRRGHIPQPPPTSRLRREVRHRGHAVRPRRSGSRPCRSGGSVPPATRPAAAPPSPSRATSRRRRSNSVRVDTLDRSFLCVIITQEYVAARHDDQQPRIARVTAPSAANPSADNRCRRTGSPRSVHASGTVIWPLTPPEHTNTVSPARRLRYRTSSR